MNTTATDKQIAFINSLIEKMRGQFQEDYGHLPAPTLKRYEEDYANLNKFWQLAAVRDDLTGKQASALIDILKQSNAYENAPMVLADRNGLGLLGAEAKAFFMSIAQR